MTVPDLRRIEQFVAAMEEPSLAAAASRLHLTQQALSAGLRQLEKELGTALFTRSGRRLAPTPAARTLYDGAPALLSGARLLTTRVREAGAEQTRPFVVGRSPAVTAEETYFLLEPLLAQSDRLSVTVRELFPSSMVDELRSGSVNIVVRRGVSLPEQLAGATLTYHPLRVALHHDHSLATRQRISMADLADTPIVVWAPPHTSFYTDFLVAQCRRAGFEPELIINRVQGTPPATAVLASAEAAAFVTGPVGPWFGGRVTVHELDDAAQVPVQALWLPHTTDPIRSALLAAYPST